LGKPPKTLPTFDLAAFSGKTWSVKPLNGKVGLINLWANWCGPLQFGTDTVTKTLRVTKGRSDSELVHLVN
jgi:hypothetical protein